MAYHEKIFSFFLLLLLVGITPSYAQSRDPDVVVRAALDVGSGATKLRVAEVNLRNHKIERILTTQSFSVPYQEQLLQSKDGTFNDQVMTTGLDAMKQSAEIARKYGAEKVIAVATAAFRKAHNAPEFIDRIYNETGIPVYVIDQELEGKLAFQAAQSELGVNPLNLVVWDIGGGSLQLTAMNSQHHYVIYRGHEASIPFRNHVIEKIERKSLQDTSSPNPMTFEQIFQSMRHARYVASEVDHYFKHKISEPQTVVVGVGNIFSYQIMPMLGNKETITMNELAKSVNSLVGKTDKDVGGGDFANVYVTNAILVLGHMDALNIQKMQIADINPADGALVYSPFWQQKAPVSEPACVY